MSVHNIMYAASHLVGHISVFNTKSNRSKYVFRLQGEDVQSHLTVTILSYDSGFDADFVELIIEKSKELGGKAEFKRTGEIIVTFNSVA